MKFIRVCIVTIFASALLLSCAYNPVTGKKELSLMSPQQELALGKQSDPGIIQSFGMYDNETLQRFINEKGKAMGAISHRPDLEFQFRLLDSPVVNAFAVPGGYIYFTRGIMAHFNNEAEFAGVLGHEIGHVTARHSAKQYTNQVLAQVGLMAGMIFSEEFRQYGGAASQGLQLLFLKFGRDHESQSDRLGVEYSTKIGYDAKHMANFFNTLSTLSGGPEGRVPTFMSTHPDPLDRYRKVGELAGKAQAENPGKTFKEGRNEYLKMIDGLVYGEDPRQGYVENSRFYHPELKFQYQIPNGWKTQNTPQQVQMADPNGKAMMLLMLGQGNSLKEAGQKFITDNKLTLVDSRNVNVNGLQALRLISDQYPQQQQGQQSNAAAPNSMAQKSPSKADTKSGNAESDGGTKVQYPTRNMPQKTPTKTQPKSNPYPSKNTPPSNNNSPSQNSPGNNPPPANGVAPELRIMTYLIQYGDIIYMMHGLSKYPDFQGYAGILERSMKSFNRLSDPSKINVKPERIKIRTVTRNSSLEGALKGFGTPQTKLKQLAVLNGMKLEDQVSKGMLIKTLGK